MQVNTTTPKVSIGIDAAVVAAHQIAVRGEIRDDFRVMPTLAGLAKLTKRLEPYAGAMVVAEPTAGTWLPLAHAVTGAGWKIGFVANRDSARLRRAIVGASKTDVIDADMLARCEDVLGVDAAVVPPPGQIALRRAMRRRHVATIDAHRVECRLWALGAWAFPDLWRACGGHTLAQPLLRRWPHLEQLSRARASSIVEVVADHSRDQNPARRTERISDAAKGWATFWAGRLDLEALAWEVAAVLDDIDTADRRHNDTTDHALRLRRTHWPDDVLVSIPGLGPICAATIRGWWGNARQFHSAKAATAHAGLNPSMWSSGLSEAPSRKITKQGSAELRLALYQSANVARRHDPQLAEHYRRLMCERGHNHISANTAVARKLACRAWAVATTGRAYEPRDLDGEPITSQTNHQTRRRTHHPRQRPIPHPRTHPPRPAQPHLTRPDNQRSTNQANTGLPQRAHTQRTTDLDKPLGNQVSGRIDDIGPPGWNLVRRWPDSHLDSPASIEGNSAALAAQVKTHLTAPRA